jgi:membrane-associated phospholipid phosphatase
MIASAYKQLTSIILPLKPVDRIVIFYLVITLPLLVKNIDFLCTQWTGVLLRLILIPIIINLRKLLSKIKLKTNLITSLMSNLESSESFKRRHLSLQLQMFLTFCLDIYPLLVCIYCYSEDGSVINNMNPRFLDVYVQNFERQLFGLNNKEEVGNYLRSLTSRKFNKLLGEYLHFCYFSFYCIMTGTYILAWMRYSREQFDYLSASECGIYLLSLGLYLIIPVEGPFWEGTPPNPDEVGYFFSFLAHKLVKNGSSRGTAFPSSHCGITTAIWLFTTIYKPVIASAYLLLCPGIILATVWCGFHYFVDSVTGVVLALLVTPLLIYLCKETNYLVPEVDRHNYKVMPDEKFRHSSYWAQTEATLTPLLV